MPTHSSEPYPLATHEQGQNFEAQLRQLRGPLPQILSGHVENIGYGPSFVRRLVAVPPPSLARKMRSSLDAPIELTLCTILKLRDTGQYYPRRRGQRSILELNELNPPAENPDPIAEITVPVQLPVRGLAYGIFGEETGNTWYHYYDYDSLDAFPHQREPLPIETHHGHPGANDMTAEHQPQAQLSSTEAGLLVNWLRNIPRPGLSTNPGSV